MQTLKAGPLKAVVISPKSGEDVARDIVLLHGYGAPGTDLVGLERAISTSVPTRFVYLEAPHTLDGQVGPHAGRAWWHIDMMALHIARMTGAHDELAAQKPEGLGEARELLGAALLDLGHQIGLKLERTVLGGFSQGAMLSCDFALHSSVLPEALLQLSGTVICESEWKHLMNQKAGLRVFQSHAPDDMVLPFVLAERHRDNFLRAGVKVDFVSFRGGHGISPLVLERLSQFLAQF
jgi:phospholipase/carboxylesterase